MMTVNRSRANKAAISLRTVSVVAMICFMVGAMLPSGILQIAVPVSHATTPTGDGNEQAFMNENDTAMRVMMADMAVKPTGDVNRDFVAMMIPHHQGAIDMAKALLLHGDNEALRRIAQEIVITQQQEIVAMRLAIGESAQATASDRTTPHTTGNAPDDIGGMQMSPNSMKMK
jgi:hypothetical protein